MCGLILSYWKIKTCFIFLLVLPWANPIFTWKLLVEMEDWLLSGGRRQRLSRTYEWTTRGCFEDGMEAKHTLCVNDYLGTSFMWLLERSFVSNGQTWWQSWGNLTSPYAFFAILPMHVGKCSSMSNCCIWECLLWNFCAMAIDIHCTYSLEASDNLSVHKGPFSRSI